MMSYPGSAELDPKVQQRILTAFGEALRLYRDGLVEESLTILRSILEVDPRFAPAQRLSTALTTGAAVDLGELYGELAASEPIDVEATVARAREALAQRNLQDAQVLAQSVLRELPGHAEARQLTLDIQAALKAGEEAERYISQAGKAFVEGRVSEAIDLVEMARKLDAGIPALADLEVRLKGVVRTDVAGAQPPSPEPPDLEPLGSGPPSLERSGAELPGADPLPPQEEQPPGVEEVEEEEQEEYEFASTAPPAQMPAGPAQPDSGPSPEATAPVVVEGQPPEDVPTGFAFDSGSPDSAPVFGPPAGGDAAAPAAAAPMDEETRARVRALIEEGRNAFDQGDDHAAIDTWSRIFLLDPDHAQAEQLISQARLRVEERDRLVEQHFHEARTAFEKGLLDKARTGCQKVLELHPRHLEAHDLLARLETPAAPPPPPPPPEGEEDLFRDEFVPAKAPSGATKVLQRAPKIDRKPPTIALPSLASLRKLPLPLVGGVAGAMILIAVVAAVMLRGGGFSGDGDAAVEAIVEAQRLADAGRLQDAVTLLRSLELEGEQAHQVNMKVLEYQRSLKARPTPPQVEDTAVIREAMEAGRRLLALSLIREGLAKVPADPDLLQLKEELTRFSATLPDLLDAARDRKWQSARQLATLLYAQHRDDSEARRVWEAVTFNLALELLRTYQVAGAHALLDELAQAAPDGEVQRLQELAASYLSRPVDPRYEIFLRSIEERPVLEQ